jgi:NAD(P)-dependent dehydrogenase (short-subunit alcohol dehydrogenase family)
MTGDFAGKTAVVTGGSDGLGRDFCRALTEAGCRVYFCARGHETGAAAAEALGSLAHFVQADLSVPDQIAALARHVGNAETKIDYLINNVAVDDRLPFDSLTLDACDRMWQTNTRSYLLTTHAFIGLLRAGSGKSIVNIGTTNYMLGLTHFTLYNATKSAILGYTRSLARELGPEGIRANMVSPGWIMTEKQLREHVTEQDKADLIRDQCLKFLLTPEHVTPLVLFLLGSDSRGITGQNIVVDGGKVVY